MNTQSSAHLGSHWFTVVVGVAQETAPQLLQSIVSSSAAGSMLEPSQHPQSTGTPADPNINNYPNLFVSPDPDLSDALAWAHGNAMEPRVATWLRKCGEWDSAVATKEYKDRKKRRKLCKDHGIKCPKDLDTYKDLATIMEYIRRQLINEIKEIRTQPLLQSKATGAPRAHSMQQRSVSANITMDPPRKKTEHCRDNKLDNYFTPRAVGEALPEIEELHIPEVATDVTSTYLRLHAKRHIYGRDKDFGIVKDTLSELRGYVNRQRLSKITTCSKQPRTIRAYFKEAGFGTINFTKSPAPGAEASDQQPKEKRPSLATPLAWTTYYSKLLVLAQARRWLSAAERLDPIADVQATPKTHFHLADAIKKSNGADCVPFGFDFEDTGAYSPVVSRLLLYAEIHNCSDHDFGTFSSPKTLMPYTYRQLQEWIMERRRRQQRSDANETSSREIVQTVDDLAAKLCAFASDATVVKQLILFALPPKKHAHAVEITVKVASAASEHAKIDNHHDEETDDALQAKSAATEHARSSGDDSARPDDVPRTTGAATKDAVQPKKQLKAHDDSHKTDVPDVTLSRQTADEMADSFFKFVQKEHLQQHLSRVTAGQILVLCIFHSRLLWQKGKPLELHERDQYWIIASPRHRFPCGEGGG